jgi:hypothetical protein
MTQSTNMKILRYRKQKHGFYYGLNFGPKWALSGEKTVYRLDRLLLVFY